MKINGEQIREARERLHLTQQELADQVGVSMRTVGNWERGASVPRNRLGAVAEALSLDIEGERDFGQQAIRRRLGVLAQQRRDKMLMSRVTFAQFAGMADQAVSDFESAKRWPRTATLRKFEDALGWKPYITEDIINSSRRASTIEHEDLDDPNVDRPISRPVLLRGIPTDELLAELGRRFAAMQASVAQAEPEAAAEYDLAADQEESFQDED